MRLKGKKVAILAEDLYEDLELWYPYYRLKEEGADVQIIGSGRSKTFTSKHGYPVTADASAEAAKGGGFDAVIIPGGYSPDLMRRSPAMVALVREAASKGKVVAAICHGGWMLCSAGVVRGKRATCFFAIKDDLVNAGAKYVDEEVVVDGNIITSRTPADLPAFSREIIKGLERG